MTSAFSLAGKVAIVTGAASGIGLSTARTFLAAGAKGVTLVDLHKGNLARVQSELEKQYPGRILAVSGDAAAEEATQEYVGETMNKWGHLDVSIQNAGVCGPTASIVDLTAQQFDSVMSINLRSAFLGLKYSVKAMLQNKEQGRGGSIVLCSSQLGLDGSPHHSAYAASKFAVRGLAVSVAGELGQHNIRVNSVCPGAVETPLVDDFYKEPGSREACEAKVMLGRLGKPDEIANAFLYLASDASSYATGTTLKVDGGFSKWS